MSLTTVPTVPTVRLTASELAMLTGALNQARSAQATLDFIVGNLAQIHQIDAQAGDQIHEDGTISRQSLINLPKEKPKRGRPKGVKATRAAREAAVTTETPAEKPQLSVV